MLAFQCLIKTEGPSGSAQAPNRPLSSLGDGWSDLALSYFELGLCGGKPNRPCGRGVPIWSKIFSNSLTLMLWICFRFRRHSGLGRACCWLDLVKASRWLRRSSTACCWRRHLLDIERHWIVSSGPHYRCSSKNLLTSGDQIGMAREQMKKWPSVPYEGSRWYSAFLPALTNDWCIPFDKSGPKYVIILVIDIHNIGTRDVRPNSCLDHGLPSTAGRRWSSANVRSQRPALHFAAAPVVVGFATSSALW